MEFLPEVLQEYADNHSSEEPEVLQELSRETHLKVLYPQMLSGHLAGRFQSLVSKLLNPGLIIEVGTYTGYSAICLAEGLNKNGILHTIDNNPEIESIARKYWEKAGISGQIEFHCGHAADIIPEIEGEVDLAFIDADKQNYSKYYDLIFPKLRSGGVILADNVLWSGKVADPEEDDKETTGLREFNEKIRNSGGIDHALLPIRDGIMMIRKR